MKSEYDFSNGKRASDVPHLVKFREENIVGRNTFIPEGGGVPHAIVGKVIKEGQTYLRAWREYLDLTQAELAIKAGITQAALSQMESGESKLRKATRVKLAAAMGINPDQLV